MFNVRKPRCVIASSKSRRGSRQYRLGRVERLEDRRLLCIPVTGSPFQNPDNPCDVSGDGSISGLDTLAVINFIVNNGSGRPPAGFQPPPFVDVDGDGLVNEEDSDVMMAVTGPGIVGPIVMSATLGSDSQSATVQFNDDDLNQSTAEDLANYGLTAANGDADANGDFFDDGDETPITITAVAYSAVSDQVNLTFGSTLADDVFRLDLDGIAIQDLDGNGLTGGNYFRDFDLSTTTPTVAVLDVNGDGTANPFQDGILIVRFMLGQPDANLEDPALITAGSTRTTGAQIRTFLQDAGDVLDANGDGMVNPFQDGILIVRFLLGQPDSNLEDSALIPAGSTRTTGDAIRSYLETLMPTTG